jgi:peptidoglycan/LPS O-acetylase OafA/YrhL
MDISAEQMVRSAQSGQRFAVLDGLRGVAALIVVIYHFQTSIPALQFTFGGQPHMLFSLGWLSVDFFFMLSGFVICHTYQSRFERGLGIGEFIVRRLMRLYPMIAIGFVLGFAVLALEYALGQLSDWPAIAWASSLNTLFVPSFNHINFPSFSETITSTTASGKLFVSDPPAWSLFFELLANIAFAFIFRFRVWQAAALVAVSFVAMLGFSAWHFHAVYGGWGFDLDAGSSGLTFIGGFPRVIFGFWSGVLLYHLHGSLHARLKLTAASPAFVYIALAVFLCIPLFIKGLLPLIFLLIVGPALILVSASLQGLTPSRRNGPKDWVGFPIRSIACTGQSADWCGRSARRWARGT